MFRRVFVMARQAGIVACAATALAVAFAGGTIAEERRSTIQTAAVWPPGAIGPPYATSFVQDAWACRRACIADARCLAWAKVPARCHLYSVRPQQQPLPSGWENAVGVIEEPARR